MPDIETLDDQILVRRAVAGEAECFTVLVHRHLGALNNHIRSMLRNETEADDLVQEVLLKAWLHLPAFRFESSFRTWAMRIATNEVIQSFRRERRQGLSQPVDDFDMLASPRESPIQSVVRVEREQVVRRAVSRLPITHRRVLVLRYLQEKNERETARCLESSTAAVKSRLFRARKMLLASFERERFDVADHSRGFPRHEARRS
jgi:RNA polymerase sigma-70 factor (ECF subfamily)